MTLIVGSPRSGTSLLAALVGAHPEAAILNEDITLGWRKLVGKPVIGNKLTVPNLIDLDRRRRPWYGPAKRLRLPPGPASVWSIRDYLAAGVVVIGIARDPGPAVESMVVRGGLSREAAQRRWDRSQTALEHADLTLSYAALTANPKAVLSEVCARLGLAYSESMLRGAEYQTEQYRVQSSIRPST